MRMIRPIAMTDAIFNTSTIPETDATEWSAVTAYVAGNVAMVSTTYHTIYKCLVGNTNKFPPDNIDNGYWQKLYRTNRWRMWDEKSKSASFYGATIDVSVIPGELFNAMALLNVVADDITVQVTDPTEGLVYDRDIDMLDLTGITDFYEWFFEPLANKTSIALFDLPAYPAASLRIIVYNTGGNREVGEFVFGTLKELGRAQYPYNVSVDNYSKKKDDPDDGYPIIDEKKFFKIVDYNLLIDPDKVANIENEIGIYLNTPAVYVGYLDDDDAESAGIGQETIIYGYVKSFDANVEGIGVANATARLSIEELI